MLFFLKKKTTGAKEVLLVLPLCSGGDLQATIDSARSNGYHHFFFLFLNLLLFLLFLFFKKNNNASEWLDGTRIARLFYGIACGVRALHGAEPSLAHFDLKPGN